MIFQSYSELSNHKIRLYSPHSGNKLVKVKYCAAVGFIIFECDNIQLRIADKIHKWYLYTGGVSLDQVFTAEYLILQRVNV